MKIIYRYILCAGIIVFGLIFFTRLLYSQDISGEVYLGLIALTIFASLAIPNLDRLKEFDLKKLRATLSEIEVKSKEIKYLGKEISGLIAISTVFLGRRGYPSEAKKLIESKILGLLSKLQEDGSAESILKYNNLYQKRDASDNPEKIDSQIAQELRNDLEREHQ